MEIKSVDLAIKYLEKLEKDNIITANYKKMKLCFFR